MKSILIDSSSAILLYSADLIDYLTQLYHPLMTTSVFNELTIDGTNGAHAFRFLCQSGKITVHDITSPFISRKDAGKINLSGLDLGERDTIIYFLTNEVDFIIIDDGKAAKKLSHFNIPFINALLFPKVLYVSDHLRTTEYERKTLSLEEQGRYAEWVRNWARNCTGSQLERFLP